MKEGKLHGTITEYSTVILNKMFAVKQPFSQGRAWMLVMKSLLLPPIKEENTGGEWEIIFG